MNEPEYIELNVCNYNQEDVEQLNDWGIWAASEIERLRTELDNEQSRWQAAIYGAIRSHSGCTSLDGSGCESGDPLDVTLSEIAQAFNFIDERKDEAADEIERLHKDHTKAVELLARCYQCGHRDGWEDGESTNEVMEAVNDYFANIAPTPTARRSTRHPCT